MVYNSFVVETISVNVYVSDNSGRVVAKSLLYWKEESYEELDKWGIPVTNGVGIARLPI